MAHQFLLQGVGQISLSRSILVHPFILKRGTLEDSFGTSVRCLVGLNLQLTLRFHLALYELNFAIA